MEQKYLALLPIVSVVMIVIALYFVMKEVNKPIAYKNTSAFYKRTPEDDAIDLHNQTLKRWHILTETTNNALVKKNCELILKRDDGAKRALSEITREFTHYGDEVLEYIKRSSESITARNFGGSIYCTAQANDLMDRAEELTRSISALSVEDFTKEFENIKPQRDVETFYGSTIFMFKGCLTREDVDARYKRLAKAFHPDNTGGDKTMFEELQRQYKRAKEARS